MIYNIEAVEEMLEELRQVDQEIYCIRQVINHGEVSPGVMALAHDSILRKLEVKNSINWLLEDEFEQGLDLIEILEDNEIQDIQRS